MCITAVLGVAEPAGDGAWCSWRPRERSNWGERSGDYSTSHEAGWSGSFAFPTVSLPPGRSTAVYAHWTASSPSAQV